MNNKEIEEYEDKLAKYKVPCSCPKGGLVGLEERPCERCDGTQWVFPDDLRKALTTALEDAFLEGLKRHTWMKDGVTYVGNGTYTLKEAVKSAEQDNLLTSKGK